jgi:hypothetical protein
VGRLGTMQTATYAVTEHRPPKPRAWSQTDLQAECSRPLSVDRKRYASAQGCREKTSNPVLRRRDHGNRSCMMQGDSEESLTGLTKGYPRDATIAPTKAQRTLSPLRAFDSYYCTLTSR